MANTLGDCNRCYGYGRIPFSGTNGGVLTFYNSYECQTCQGTGHLLGFVNDNDYSDTESSDSSSSSDDGGIALLVGFIILLVIYFFGNFVREWLISILSGVH